MASQITHLDRLRELEDGLDRVSAHAGTFAGQVAWALDELAQADETRRQRALGLLRDALTDFQSAMRGQT